MKSTPIPIKRELVDFHRQAKEVGATTTLKNHELTNLRKKLLNKVKSLQEIRCLTSLRTGYFLKLSSSNVQSTSQLPFMKPNGFKIAERLVELSGISSYRSNITKLLKELYTQLDKLPEKLALLNFDNFPDNPPYLPAGVKAREFFVCSTVPALFGYNWAVELRESFLSFIFSIAEHIPSSTLQNFREHWLFDCIKNYIHSSGINQFLRISIGSTIYRLVRDQELQRLSKLPNDQQIFFDKLTEYASDMINHMHENIEIFPSDVRTIIRRFTTLSKDTETRLSRAETLFLDSILVPSISNPKAYGVLPSTFYLDISPFGPARCLQMLAQLFRFILHPNQIKLRYPKYDSAKIELLPFEPFLNDLISIDDNKEYVLTGPKLNDILPTLKAHFILLLFSLPDIFLLSDVLQLVLTNGTLLNVAKKLQTNQSVSFDFFRYEVWDFDVFRIKKPIIPDEEIEKLPKNKSSIVGDAIYKFMEFFDVDETSPNGYEQFFEYHEHNMILQHKYIHETYIRNLNMAYNDVPKDEKNTIIPSLEAEFRRRINYINCLDINISKTCILLHDVKEDYNQIQRKNKDTLSILIYYILTLYLQKNPNVLQQIQSSKNEFLENKETFSGFINENLIKIKEFIAPFADYTLNDVVYNFHSYVMQQITLNDFQCLNDEELKKKDAFIYEKSKQNLECYRNKMSDKFLGLILTPSNFAFIIHKLKEAMFLEIPIEALRIIHKSLKLVRHILKLEYFTKPEQDEISEVFVYILLQSEITNLYSMSKYLETFLQKLPNLKIKVIDEEQEEELNSFIQYVYSVEKLLVNMSNNE